jgi:hypothetical protein
MPKPNKEIKQLLINDFGYEPVELESYTGQLRALKESFNSLQIKDPKDARLRELAIAIKDLRAQREVEKDTTGKLKVTRKRRKDAKTPEQVKAEIDAKDKAIADRKAKKKKDAMNFISPASAPPDLPPAESESGGDMSGVLTKIAGDVNIIKGIVEAQKNIEEDKIEDTREAREKKKRSMAENLMEGGKKMYEKVAGTFGKVLAPAKGIFESIFKFLALFFLGSALMKILDWFGNPANKDKIQSIFRFLKDFWPVIAAGIIALMGPIPAFVAAIGLAFAVVPKIIDFVKSIFGLNKDVDKEIKKEEKDYEKNRRTLQPDTDKEEKEQPVKQEETPPEQQVKQEETPSEQQDAEKMNKGGMVPDRGNVTKMNQGGEVPGQGNTDTVPAMLTPGEFVLTKDAVNKVGADTLYNINAAAGGVGKPSQQEPAKPTKKSKMKTSTVGTMMNMGGMKMGGMTNNMSYMGKGGMTNNTSYMKEGGMINNMSYMGEGGMANVQYMKLGGMVKNFISKTPQARAFNFAKNQLKKLPVPPPLSRMASKIPKLEFNLPNISGGSDSIELKDEIPSFNVTAPGGSAKEQTLGIRR